MAYSNVTRPDLPGTYDPAAHPNYVMVFDYGQGADEWYMVHMYYSGTAFVFDGKHITNTESVVRKNIYADGLWLGEESGDGAPALSPGLHGDVYQRIYTNHDILDGDGNVYLAADTVTPVKLFDLKSWLTGFALGLAGKPLPLAVRKPVAYLYNGVRLPELPEWDKEKYPYVVIERTGSALYNYAYALRLFQKPYKITGTQWMVSHFVAPEGDEKTYTACACPYTDNGDGTFVWSEPTVYNIPDDFRVQKPIWCNYDLGKSDGTVLLAASDPVPVYE